MLHKAVSDGLLTEREMNASDEKAHQEFCAVTAFGRRVTVYLAESSVSHSESF